MVAGILNASLMAHERNRRVGELYLRYRTLEFLNPYNRILKLIDITETGEAVHPYLVEKNPVPFEHKFRHKEFENFSKENLVSKPIKGRYVQDYLMNETIEHFSKYLDNEIKKFKKSDKEKGV